MKYFVKRILSDAKGIPSHKRIISLFASFILGLCTLIYHTELLYNICLILALGQSSLSTLDKHIDKNK